MAHLLTSPLALRGFTCCVGRLALLQEGAYALNLEWSYKKTRVKIDQPIKSEAKADSDKTHKDVEDDRKLVVQAYLVRIMKMRKQMKHTLLIDETIKQLRERFKPKISVIKVWCHVTILGVPLATAAHHSAGEHAHHTARVRAHARVSGLPQRSIDMLIEKEYLRRLDGTRDEYAYVA